jgi:F0F1-type ATP synthase membrane subunit b/b'
MKRMLILSPFILLVLPILAMRTMVSTGADFLRRLNIPEDRAHECIWSSFQGMYLSIPNVSALKAIARGDRAALVREIGNYARAYTRSEDFAKRYLAYREQRKPSPPEPPKSMEEMKREQRENIEKAIKSTEESMKSMTKDMQESMQGTLDLFKEQLKTIDDPDNPSYSKDMEHMVQQGYEMQKQQYQQDLQQWEKEYPNSSDLLIKTWLKKFLSASEGIDYNAKLIDGIGTSKVFANPAYEQKPGEWKMCYRAGRETVEAGRAYARQWLNELPAGQ